MPRGPGSAFVISEPRREPGDAGHAALSLYEFLVSDKRGERALKKAKNWGGKIRLPSRKAKGCLPGDDG